MAKSWQSILLTAIRDPLIWFLLAGGLLFWWNSALDRYDQSVIVIDPALVQKLSVQWQGQTGRLPTPKEVNLLVENYINEEVLVREARNLGLDQDDVIIRRRLAQKTEFFVKDTAPPGNPEVETLQAFYAENQKRYQHPEIFSFRHVFADSEPKATALLPVLEQASADWRSLGQPFILNREYANRSATDVSQIFGAEFVSALSFLTPSAGWSKPIRSAYGWHLVQLINRQALAQRPFEEVAERVLFDWQQFQSDTWTAEKWAELRARYRVELYEYE